MKVIEVDKQGKYVEKRVGTCKIATDGNGVILVKKYLCNEVVKINCNNINKLKYMGYDLKDKDIVDGGTYILRRKDCILHTAKPMEKLVDIATKYNISVQKLMEDNNLKTDKLYIGQIVVIY